MLNGICTDLIDGAGLVGIDECTGCVDGDGLSDGGELELESRKQRERRANSEQLGDGRKAGLRDFEAVDPVGEVLDVELTIGAGFEGGVNLVGFAENVNVCFEAMA